MTIMKTNDSRDLITASRLDVFSKIDYVRTYLDGYPTSWSRAIYRSYLHATKPSGDFNENGTKFSIQDYERDFIELIKSCRESGFDSSISKIPVSKRGIVDGSHRLAISLCLGLKPEVEDSNEEDHVYDFRFVNRIGLDPIYRQHMSWNLLTYRNDSRAFLLTDLDKSLEDRVIDAISDFAQIVTIEKVDLTKIGQRRMMELAYGHNEWWKPQFRESMVSERFSRDRGTCSTVFFIGSDLSRLNDFKSSLRELLGNSNFDRQIHGTDFFSDTIALAEVFLNKNGLHFINNAPIDSESRIVSILGGPIQHEEADGLAVPWCIDGSAVMEIYGVREARDIDYVSINDGKLLPSIKKAGENHKKEFFKYPISEYDLVSDPRLHFRFKGHKFMALSTLMFIKSSLLDAKALQDINLIARFFDSGGPVYSTSDMRSRARLWRFELILNAIFVKVIGFLPVDSQDSLKKSISRLRKMVIYRRTRRRA